MAISGYFMLSKVDANWMINCYDQTASCTNIGQGRTRVLKSGNSFSNGNTRNSVDFVTSSL